MVAVGYMGAPVILVEKLPSGLETSDATKAVEPYLAKVLHAQTTVLKHNKYSILL